MSRLIDTLRREIELEEAEKQRINDAHERDRRRQNEQYLIEQRDNAVLSFNAATGIGIDTGAVRIDVEAKIYRITVDGLNFRIRPVVGLWIVDVQAICNKPGQWYQVPDRKQLRYMVKVGFFG